MELARKVVGGIAVSLMLSACGPGAMEPAPTVEYYRAHADEREAQMKVCANDPGTAAGNAACTNALEATQLEKNDNLRGLPPMGLPSEKAN